MQVSACNLDCHTQAVASCLNDSVLSAVCLCLQELLGLEPGLADLIHQELSTGSGQWKGIVRVPVSLKPLLQASTTASTHQQPTTTTTPAVPASAAPATAAGAAEDTGRVQVCESEGGVGAASATPPSEQVSPWPSTCADSAPLNRIHAEDGVSTHASHELPPRLPSASALAAPSSPTRLRVSNLAPRSASNHHRSPQDHSSPFPELPLHSGISCAEDPRAGQAHARSELELPSQSAQTVIPEGRPKLRERRRHSLCGVGGATAYNSKGTSPGSQSYGLYGCRRVVGSSQPGLLPRFLRPNSSCSISIDLESQLSEELGAVKHAPRVPSAPAVHVSVSPMPLATPAGPPATPGAIDAPQEGGGRTPSAAQMILARHSGGCSGRCYGWGFALAGWWAGCKGSCAVLRPFKQGKPELCAKGRPGVSTHSFEG